MWWNACPVRAEEQEWIDESLEWCCAEFGEAPLHGTAVLPTPEFFPGEYHGKEADVLRVLRLVCGWMDVDPDLVVLEFHDENVDPELLDRVPLEMSSRGAAGHFRQRDGKAILSVESSQARRPMSLVATIAHELGHQRLLGERRIDPDRRDGEPLTDLATVFFGLGIFAANAALEFTATADRTYRQRLGYLTEPMYGYALAWYATRRGERSPAWAKHLDPNPRAALKQGLRYLRRGAK